MDTAQAPVIEAPAAAPAAEPTPAPESTPTPAGDATPAAATGEGKGKIKLPASIKPPVKTGRFQARISDLVAQRDGERREKESLREELSRMRGIPKKDQNGQPVTGAKTAVTIDGDGADTLSPEQFETYAEYVAALVNKTIEKRQNSEKSERAEAAYETYRSEKLTVFNEKAAPLVAEYGDGFWDAITDPSLPITEAMADAVMELDELGPYTMLYLAANKDKAMAIARMNPRAATIAIGRLASQLDYEIKHGSAAPVADGGTPPAPVTDATPGAPPKPSVVPVPRGSAPSSLDAAPNDKDSVDEWLRKETDRLRRINPNARFYGAR